MNAAEVIEVIGAIIGVVGRMVSKGATKRMAMDAVRDIGAKVEQLQSDVDIEASGT